MVSNVCRLLTHINNIIAKNNIPAELKKNKKLLLLIELSFMKSLIQYSLLAISNLFD